MRAARQDQRHGAEVRQADARPVGHARQAGGADHEQMLVEQRHHAPALRGFFAKQDRQVDLPRTQHRTEIARQALDHAQPDIRIAPSHRLHEREAEYAGRTGRKPDADVPRQARLTRGERRIVDVAQRELRLSPECKAGVRRHDARGGALQQARGQLALEPADLLAQCGRHHAQFQRGLAHAAVFHDADEIAQLPQFHRHLELTQPRYCRSRRGAGGANRVHRGRGATPERRSSRRRRSRRPFRLGECSGRAVKAGYMRAGANGRFIPLRLLSVDVVRAGLHVAASSAFIRQAVRARPGSHTARARRRSTARSPCKAARY